MQKFCVYCVLLDRCINALQLNFALQTLAASTAVIFLKSGIINESGDCITGMCSKVCRAYSFQTLYTNFTRNKTIIIVEQARTV